MQSVGRRCKRSPGKRKVKHDAFEGCSPVAMVVRCVLLAVLHICALVRVSCKKAAGENMLLCCGDPTQPCWFDQLIVMCDI